MNNPIQNEHDLVVFLELIMENTHHTIEQHNPQEMETYLNQWNYITQYAREHPEAQSTLLLNEIAPIISNAIQGIGELYKLVTGVDYIAPHDRSPPLDAFSTSRFLQRVSKQRDSQSDAEQPPPRTVPPKNGSP